MKKLLLLTILLTLFLSACGGPTDAECKNAWYQLEVGGEILTSEYIAYEDYVEAFDTAIGAAASSVLNREHAPDTVGFVVKECIQNGWDYRAASGMPSDD